MTISSPLSLSYARQTRLKSTSESLPSADIYNDGALEEFRELKIVALNPLSILWGIARDRLSEETPREYTLDLHAYTARILHSYSH